MIDSLMVTDLPLEQVVYRDDLYPRIKADTATIERYAANLEVLPPIEVNQNGILIDGFHRWTAHRQAEAATIRAFITETASEAEVYALAIERNAIHGLQMNDQDKRMAAIRLYAAGTGYEKDEIARILSVSQRSITTYLSDIDKDLREKRKQRIFDMWMACATQQEISEDVGIPQQTLDGLLPKMEDLPNSVKVAATFQDADFTPPIYNVWAFAKKTNEVKHFGNSEQRIVENLLYLYTEPFDIVVDPFAGGGSTIDVCLKRSRRYWVSDRKPKVSRETEIRKLDINDDVPPLNKRWSEVTLTYLDPPYWRQAEGKYSEDAEDFANMPLDQFRHDLASVVMRIAKRQTRGVIALLIQPTQWRADERKFTDHIHHLLQDVKLPVEMRVSVPYPTEQCTPQQVEWAKANKQLLVLSRELIIWRVQS